MREESRFLHVNKKLIGLSLACLDISKLFQIDKLAIYSEDRYGPVYIYTGLPLTQGLMKSWLSVCPLLLALVSTIFFLAVANY